MLCWPCLRPTTMGNAVAQEAGAPAITSQPTPTMADVIRERKKKSGGVALGTLRRRLAAAARAERKQDRGCEHARYIRGVVSRWRLPEVAALCEELEAGAALRDLTTVAQLSREPASALQRDLTAAYRHGWWCDVQLVGAGYCIAAHRAVLAARCTYFRDLLARHPSTAWVVPLEGAGATLSRDEMDTVVRALYGSCQLNKEWDSMECGLDGAAGDASDDECRCPSLAGTRDGVLLRRLGAALGFRCDALHADLLHLLHSGEYADARLVFRLEGGCGAQYGFRTALELPCHRVVLASRSRYFRSMLSCRVGGGPNGVAFCVDDSVLPARVARALLHAVYTDQVDLSLITRSVSPPTSTSSSTSSHTPWSSVSRTSSSQRDKAVHDKLDDAFALYEIARFLEMPIVVQGCEDAIVSLLSPATLPHVLRWSAASHASQWVHRQAMRYLTDEFPSCMSDLAAASLPRAAVAQALASPFLQCSEGQALKSLIRWAERTVQAKANEPNVLFHTPPAGVSGWRGGRARGEGTDQRLGAAIQPLLPLVRLQLLVAAGGSDADYAQQLARRGILPASLVTQPSEQVAMDAWLGRNGHPPPRCFLPYLDQLKALLEGQSVPEAEIQRVRRAGGCQRIPDTLYMVSPPSPSPMVAPSGAVPPLPARTVAALRRRAAALLAAHTAQRAQHRTAKDTQHAVHVQIALRCVREMSLPDSCVDVVLSGLEWDSARLYLQPDCCRSAVSATNSLRRASASSLPNATAHSAAEMSMPCGLPDIALAPNANTHLLSARDYPRGGGGGGGGAAGGGTRDRAPHVPHPPHPPLMQLDLGDGATHTPRPGSRAGRAAQLSDRPVQRMDRPMDHAQALPVAVQSRAQRDDDFRAAIELSVIRAYSAVGPSRARSVHAANTLPAHYRNDTHSNAGVSPWHPVRSPLLAPPRARGLSPPPGPQRPSSEHLHMATIHRLEPSGSAYSSASTSRNPSPSNYA